MALAAVLSAMRTIILDAPQLPETEEARRISFHALFPQLSEHEVEDLAKISPQRFSIYTRSIFNSEADLIAHYHAFTCALIERAWQKKRRESLLLRDFVRMMHAKRPWKTSTTEGLLEAFGQFLEDRAADFGEYRQHILEAAAFERHLFYARRRVDSSPKGPSPIDRKRLAALTVGEVLNLSWHIPSTTSFQQFASDIPAAYSYFQSHQGTPPAIIAQHKLFMMFGRDNRHVVRWREIPEPLYRYFTKASHGQGTLDAVAELFVETLPPGLSEQEGFVQFINFGLDLIEAGLIVVHSRT